MKLSFSKASLVLLSVLILGGTYYDSAFGATDTKRPTISITSPASGSAISETVTVTGTSSDSGSGVKKVEVKTSSSNYITATPKSPGNWSTWSISLNISGSTNITAKATDNAGNTQTSSISVTATSAPSTTTVSVGDITITEGNSGTKSATFTITRTDNLKTISVDYATADGTATSSDYTASSGTLSFAASGSLSKTISVSIKGDAEIESDETFYLDLSNCTGCNLADSQGMATISNNDLAPSSVSINDITITEGNSGSKSATFTVTRSDSLTPVSVQYKTSDGTATTADYTPESPTTLSFPTGGAISKTVTVYVKGDTTIESDETFYLDLSNCTGCNLADSQGMATISNNDSASTVTINDITITEGNSMTKSATFTVTRSDSLTPVSVQYKTSDGTATTADYTPESPTTLSFPTGGSLSKTVTVSVKGDTAVESDETFYLDLSNCTGCNLADSQGMATITNNDYPPATITIDDVTLTEGNSGAKNFVFTVSRSDNLKEVSLTYQTNDGTASYSFSDYESLSRNTLRLAEGGPLTGTITVTVNGNSVLEKDETFFVDLSNCNNCDLIDSQGVGTILNDDEFIAPPQDSSRPTLIMMMRGDVANHQEVVDVFKKYAAPSDLKFTSAGLVPKSINAQLEVNNVAFGLTLEKIYQQTQNQQGQSTYIGYDPEWFEDRESSTPEAEYKDYVNSVRTASGYAHDNGFKFLLTPLFIDIKERATEFAPYVDVVALQIPHFTRNYSTAVQTAVNDIKSVNPDAIVLVQLIPTNDTSSKQNNDVEVIIDAYNSVRDHVDGVLVYYYDSPNPAPVLERFYQGIGMVPNQ